MNMVVKLFTTSRGFPAVRYNMDKVERGEAELMLYRNFGIIDAFTNPLAADFQHYLGAVASLCRRSLARQFHAVLSVEGKSLCSQGLTNFAELWLGEMGYGKQPFIIFFHSDTRNNHVHIVSTSVELSGKKIFEGFQGVRAIAAINKLLGIDVDAVFKADVSPLLEYKFSSLSQLSSLLKAKGYKSFIKDNQFIVRKYGKAFLRLNEETIGQMILSTPPAMSVIEDNRQAINLSMKVKDNTCLPVYQSLVHNFAKRLSGFRSELSDFLFSQFSLEIIYHFKSDAITGFTAVDHKRRQVIDGAHLMNLQRLIGANTRESLHAQRFFR